MLSLQGAFGVDDRLEPESAVESDAYGASGFAGVAGEVLLPGEAPMVAGGG
jgi:hypothetical protein